jgi:hypothetical protein
MFYVVLAEHFKTRRGLTKLLRGEFSFEDDLTHKELSRQLPWNMTFRPGQKVGMSMIFPVWDYMDSTACPRCQTPGETQKNGWMIW